MRANFSLRTMLLAVAFASVVCATLRFPSTWLAGVWQLATVVILLFAVAAAWQATGRSRAWWVGFAVFGWGYFWLSLFPSTLLPNVAKQMITTKGLAAAYSNFSGGFAMGELEMIGVDWTGYPVLPSVSPYYPAVPPTAWSAPPTPTPTNAYAYDAADAVTVEGDVVPATAEQPIEAATPPAVQTGGPVSVYPSTYTPTPIIIPARLSISLEDYVRMGHVIFALVLAVLGGAASRWVYARQHAAAA